ncbi:MAG: DNA polymerase III subunit delta' [Thermaurantiacus sp.]
MLLGQSQAIEAFRAARASGRLHHGWLLAGPEGVGKRRFADMAALALLAEAEWEVPPEHPAARLVTARSHLDHFVLRPPEEGKGASTATIGIEQVRALRQFLHGTAALGRCRTVIVDPVDALNISSANALLKELEEPGQDTTLFLVSHAPGRLLPTIRSRCRTLGFGRLDASDMAAVLATIAPDLGEDVRDRLIALSEGAPGRAARLLEEGALEIVAELDALTTSDATLALARRFQPAAAAPGFALLCQLVPARIAGLARAACDHRLADLHAEVSALAARAVAQAFDRVQVAHMLLSRWQEARRLAGATAA